MMLPVFLQDLYIYLSENEVFTDFNNTEALFWYQQDLVYGDWTTGDSGDGCYEHYQELDLSEVGLAVIVNAIDLRHAWY